MACYPDPMDDEHDAVEAVNQVVEALRLAGVAEDDIASALLSKGAVVSLMAGAAPDDLLDELRLAFDELAQHLTRAPRT